MHKQLRIWILFSWSFLTIGILLGSWWAYHELGWGGWWFWDPVENASLMPWLLATGGIHSIIRPKLNSWSFFCIQSTFIFSILGTFFVRSGLLSSVHSFATDSTRGLYLLIFLLFLLFTSMLNWNLSVLSNGSLESKKKKKRRCTLLNRSFSVEQKFKSQLKTSPLETLFEQLITLQNFYFCAICGVVFCGTAAPLLVQWYCNREIITGASFYNGTLIPLFTSIFFIFIYAHYLQFFFQKTVKSNSLNLFDFITDKIFSFFLKIKKDNHFQFDILKLIEKKLAWVRSSIKTSPVFVTPIFYFFVYFLIHLLIGRIIFELNILNSIYIAICFLFICCIILSQYDNLTSLPFFINSLSNSSNQLAVRIPYSRQSNYPYIKQKVEISCNYLLRNEVQTNLFNSLNRVLVSNTDNMNFYKSVNPAFVVSPRALLTPQGEGQISLKIQNRAQFVKYSKRFSNKEMNIAHTGLIFLILGILFSNTYKFEHTEQLTPGYLGIRLGSQFCCLRSIDHSFAPTFHSICANLLISQEVNRFTLFQNKNQPIKVIEKNALVPHIEQGLCPNGSTEQSNYIEINRFVPILCMFPEKRFYYSNQNVVATKVSIYSNLFTDFYSIIGTGSIETGWFTTIIKLPFIFCIWLGFTFGVIGGMLRFLKLIQKPKLVWL